MKKGVKMSDELTFIITIILLIITHIGLYYFIKDLRKAKRKDDEAR